MKGKAFWLVTSCLVVLSLALAACAPKGPTEVTPAAPKETTPTTPKEATPAAPTAPQETVAPATEVPKYGGVVTVALERDVAYFDAIYTTSFWDISQGVPYESLLEGEWAVGPAGTDQTNGLNWRWIGQEGVLKHTGAVAESWELPDDKTMIFKIRQGVHFHNKPPVNGREVDANDAAYSIRYMYLNPAVLKTYNMISSPGGLKLLSAEATDKWTVVVKVEGLVQQFFEDVATSKSVWIVPHEVIEQYGSLKDWRNSLGTGAFMLTDYVPSSSLTFVKHPNYWQKDPVGPGKGNQLPYLNGVKALVISDKSTALTAFRTGKVDVINPANIRPSRVELEGLLKTNPETKYLPVQGGSNPFIGVRMTSTDPLAAPLMKLRVRQALAMAIDQEGMLRDLYGGKGLKRALYYIPGEPFYSTDDEMVAILEKAWGIPHEQAIMLKKMYEYHPEEAKKILAEEGYPNGFKTLVDVEPSLVDQMSIVKGYWEKIGVELEIRVRDFTTWRAFVDKHIQPAMYSMTESSRGTNPAKFITFGPKDPNAQRNTTNRMEVNDPRLNDAMDRVDKVYGDWEAMGKILKEMEAYILYQAPLIMLPTEDAYNIWQPWVKNYYGMASLGNSGTGAWAYYAWYDQDLKKQMGFK